MRIPDLALVKKEIQFRIDLDELQYNCLFVKNKNADCLHVTLYSYARRPQDKLPRFARVSNAPEMYGHVLSICDPTLFLSPTINAGCFLGTEYRDPIIRVIEIAEGVSAKLDLPKSRIVYWGTSSAGFAAAMAAIRSKEGKAVIINPLLDLSNYILRPHGAKIADVFGRLRPKDIVQRFPLRTSVLSALMHARETGEDPSLLIYQNNKDTRFFKEQFEVFQFMESVSNRSSIKYIIFSNDTGHTAEPPDIMKQIISDQFPIKITRNNEIDHNIEFESRIEYLVKNNKLDEAEREILTEKDSGELSATVLFRLSQIKLKKGQISAAFKYIIASIQKAPRYSDAYLLLSTIHLRNSNFKEAYSVAAIALFHQPTHLPSLVGLSDIALRLGNASSAHRWADKAIACSPAKAAGFIARANAYFAEGQIGFAEDAIKQAIAVAPHDRDLPERLSYIQTLYDLAPSKTPGLSG